MMNDAVAAKGRYTVLVDGVEVFDVDNVVTTEGLNHILNVAFGSTSKPDGYYLALFSNSVNPDKTWKASTFANTAGEITSNSEGYNSSTRVAWSAKTADNGVISNAVGEDYSGAAQFTITGSSTVSIQGIGLLTESAKGSTGGVLVSAAKFPRPLGLESGSTVQLIYKMSLQ